VQLEKAILSGEAVDAKSIASFYLVKPYLEKLAAL
jgi:ADP-ribose pyrophosphatase